MYLGSVNKFLYSVLVAQLLNFFNVYTCFYMRWIWFEENLTVDLVIFILHSVNFLVTQRFDCSCRIGTSTIYNNEATTFGLSNTSRKNKCNKLHKFPNYLVDFFATFFYWALAIRKLKTWWNFGQLFEEKGDEWMSAVIFRMYEKYCLKWTYPVSLKRAVAIPRLLKALSTEIISTVIPLSQFGK